MKKQHRTRSRTKLRLVVSGLLAMALMLVAGPALAVPPPAVSPFSDVPVSHPAYAEIAWMNEAGISTGWSDGTYRPSQQVDRDAMAAFFYRYKGSPSFTAPGTSPFADITPSTPFYKEMSWMKAAGISTGWLEQNNTYTYRPWVTTARDAMAAFMYRVAGQPAYTPPATSPFTDITPATQFYKEMTWLAAEGIATGVEDGTFDPAAPVTRDMMAVFMFRLTTLSVQSTTLPAAIVGVAYSAQLQSVGGQLPHTWTATGLPAGLTLSASGKISGTPTAAGTSQVVFTVKDAKTGAAKDQATKTLSLQVKAAPDPVSVVTATLPNGAIGSPYTTTTLQAGGGVGPYTWTATGLPAGLALSSAGQLSGTPTAAGSGTITVKVTDSLGGSATKQLSLAIQLAQLGISTSQLPNGVQGRAYSATVAAQGGRTPYTWSATGLPAGLSISSGGQISGTPTSAGNSTVALKVTDAASGSATKSLTISVGAPLAVVTNALPGGVQGASYGHTLSASGGVAPYTWTASGLPAGLSVSSSGQISGTPSTSGNSSVTVTAKDAGNVSVSRTLSLSISASNNCDVLRCIAITFDDGPLAYSDSLLNSFKGRNAKATFFEVGKTVAGNPAAVKRKHDAGMEIGIHGWEHIYYTNFGYNYAHYDFEAAGLAVESATGQWPGQFRPPYGYYNPTIASAAGALGMATIMWTDNTFDYEYTNAQWLRDDTVDMASRNSVILMHDGYAATASAMPGIIDDLQAQGYTLVTVSMLLGGDPQPGRVYFDDDPVYH